MITMITSEEYKELIIKAARHDEIMKYIEETNNNNTRARRDELAKIFGEKK